MGSTFLFLLVFRFIRIRTGGYHAKTPTGCL
ncbi:MAG: accessory gene regulator B family protein [Neglectibacter sp.]